MIDDPTTRPHTENERRAANEWRRAYLAAGMIAGAVTVTVCAAMVWNAVRLKLANPFDSPQMARLKTALAEHPRDEALKEKIRTLDERLRREYFRRRQLLVHGAWLLLVAVLATVFSLRKAASSGKELPMPDSSTDPPVPDRDPLRVALLITAAVMCVCAVLVILPGRLAFLQPPPRTLGGNAKAAAKTAQTPSSEPAPSPSESQPVPPKQRSSAGGQSARTSRPSLATPGRDAGRPENATASAVSAKRAFPTDAQIRSQWPQFRGPFGLGVAGTGALPVGWDGKSGKGMLWRADLDLPGNSSPVVWDDHVFLTGGTKSKHELYCYDAATGKLRWRVQVALTKGKLKEEREISEDTGYASSTPVTDGRRVFAAFVDGVVAGFDMAGKPLWSRDFGPLDNTYGHASSLAMYRDRLFVLLDQGRADAGKSKLYALNVVDGKTVWECKRPVPESWGTPVLIQVARKKQLVTVGDPWAIAYDPGSGAELWRAKVLSGEIAPSPAFSPPLVILCEPYSRVVGLRADGKGVLPESSVVWEGDEGIPDISSPVANDQVAVCVGTDGWTVCYDAHKGGKLWEKELELTVHASPLIVGDKLLITSVEGTVVVLQAGRQFKQLARMSLELPEEEKANGTPAVVGGRLYIRTTNRLFCLGSR